MPPAAARRSLRSTLPRANASASSAGAVAERWQKLDVLVLNAAMLGSLTPVQDIDPKEYSRLLSLNLLANQALIAAFDPLLRRADKRRHGRAHFLGWRRTARLLGRLWLIQGCARNLLGAYADETEYSGRIRVHIVDPGATRTRMRALAFPAKNPRASSRRRLSPRPSLNV